ncbi:multiple epidermal growth factor-like domains protein 10 [Amphibalanus amphitrite]|uniref:multiple epidermal growth factor-like domains protein 10 n=1 Tax=Amphibalanus amphitrite TaxID=1232801 RepID=UPI001C929BE8|nr:multiple epidermal growth factor-like domains protein 10 [Amphibalanus amphitrite]
MKPFQLLCLVLVVAAAGSAAAASSADQPAPVVDQGPSEVAKDGEETTSGERKGRFFANFLSLLGLKQEKKVVDVPVPHVQNVHRPIHISPVIVVKPAQPKPKRIIVQPVIETKPTLVQPVQPKPVYVQPAPPKPVYVQPAPSQPVYAQPAPSKPVYAQTAHPKPVHPQPATPVIHHGSDGCKTDYQCPKGSYCFSYNCVQCITDEHCSAGGRHSRTYQRRCEHNRCVDIWQDDVVKCTKYSACPDGQYCSAGKCTPFVPEWMPCSVAESCQSNSCLQGKCAECSQWKPCAAGQFCDHGHCKSPGKTGDSCWLSFQCKSHICWQGLCADCAHHSDCKNAGEFCDKGRCKSLLRYGYKCSENSQCVSRICDSKTQQCVDCVNSLGCPDNSFCSADLKCVRKGMFRDVCTSDNQCLSNKCGPKNRCVQCSRVQDCDSTTHFCDLVDGACTPLGRAGQICSTTEQCLPSLTCSPVTNKCVQCLFNTDCLSGQRCDNTLGMCVAKSVLGDSCVGDADCQSGVCSSVSDTCVQCRAGLPAGTLGGCTLGQFCSLEGACLTANVPLNGACLSGQNVQCAAGLVCTNRVCTSPVTAINPSPTVTLTTPTVTATVPAPARSFGRS